MLSADLNYVYNALSAAEIKSALRCHHLSRTQSVRKKPPLAVFKRFPWNTEIACERLHQFAIDAQLNLLVGFSVMGLRSAYHAVISFPQRISQRVLNSIVHKMTVSRPVLDNIEATDLEALERRLRVADVILISGTARISSVVKILTMSTWSHAILYVGDQSDLLTPEAKAEWKEKYGAESLKHLAIDADPVRLVHLRPIRDYGEFTLRHCRPEALTESDCDKVVEHALDELGREYDIGHIMRLMIFFAFPWELLPERLRKGITDFTLSTDDRICSRVLAEAFHGVGFPVRPSLMVREPGAIQRQALGVALGIRDRSRSALKLLFGGRLKAAKDRISGSHYVEIHLKGARHITPADYDISRFFSVIKDPEDLTIDYQNILVICPLPKPAEKRKRRWIKKSVETD